MTISVCGIFLIPILINPTCILFLYSRGDSPQYSRNTFEK